MTTALVVGGGVFGTSAALELQQRGYLVRVLDPDHVPSLRASSTDISKMVRTDYGTDEFYTRMSEDCFPIWRQWNQSEGFFHETGILILSTTPMMHGGFEHDSFMLAQQRGFPVQRLSREVMSRQFPLWSRSDVYQDGYYIRHGGWAESGRVVAWLAQRARNAGVSYLPQTTATSLLENPSTGRVSGVRLADGSDVRADLVVVAAGARTQEIVPCLAGSLSAVAQPIFLFEPQGDADAFTPARGFPAYAAGLSATGFYGFPLIGNLLKVGHHGAGLGSACRLDGSDPSAWVVPKAVEAGACSFVRRAWPGRSRQSLPLVGTRVCYYSDMFDGHFLIGADPSRHGLVVASGGSGHGFKFAPILGSIIADACQGKRNEALTRFHWRVRAQGQGLAKECARCADTIVPNAPKL